MTKQKIDLSSEFELRGKWWLPDTPDTRVTGTLRYSAKGDMILSLDGTLSQPLQAGQLNLSSWPVVLGESFDGKRCTLSNAFENNIKNNLPGQATSSIVYNRIACGRCFINPDNQHFESVALDFTNLNAWMARNPFEDVIEDNSRMTLSYNHPELIEITVPSLKADLVLSSNFNASHAYQKRTWTHSHVILVKPHEPKNLNWFTEVSCKLRLALSLLVGRPVHYSMFKLYVVPEHEERLPPEHVDVCFHQQGDPSPKELNHSEIPFNYPSLSQHIGLIFEKWFSQYDAFSTLCGLFFSTNVESNMPKEFKFLALIQGLESYHRLSGNDKYVSESDYETIGATLVSAIPNQINTDLRAALKARIKFGNEYSLRKRLKLILDQIPGEMRDHITSGDSNFVSKVVATRNYLTHRDETQTQDILDFPGIFNAASDLQILVQFLLLRSIGIPDQVVSKVMRTHSRYVNRLRI